MLILDGTTGCPVTTVTGTLPVANGGTGVATAIDYGFRNRIINGAMVINQRATSVTSSGYTVDRFTYGATQASKATVAQSSTAPTGFSNSLIVTSSSAYSIVSSDVFGISQYIEGNNFYDLNWGTANAQTVTLIFWVRSSLTGTFGGAMLNYAGTRSYPFTYTISSANTWEQKSITITGDTGGTWVAATNAGAAILSFGLGIGATYSGTAGSWSTNQFYSSTGATSVVGTNGATFYITGVQLEKGSTATSFDYRPYGAELALCQRYAELIYPPESVTAAGNASAGNNQSIDSSYAVPKRVSATVSFVSGTAFQYFNGASWVNGTTSFASTISSWNASVNSGSNSNSILRANGTTIIATAEL